jgi:hypothetical protein
MGIATAAPIEMLTEGTSCKPNISTAGRRMRMRFGWLWAVITVAGLTASVVLRVPWFWRALSFVPASLSAVGFLQARRGTCVSRAAEGTFEHDDFSKTKASAPDAARSRRASGTIVRDTVLIGILCAAAGAATALVR